MMKLKMKPNIHTVGSFIQMLPRHSVPTSTRKKMPVGIEINSVVTIKGPPRAGAQPDGEHVVCPYERRQARERDHRADGRAVAEHRLSRHDRGDLEQRADRRNQDHVDLGVAHQPEQVRLQPARAAARRDVEARRDRAVKDLIQLGDEEERKGVERQRRRDDRAPHEDRQPVERHPLRSHAKSPS